MPIVKQRVKQQQIEIEAKGRPRERPALEDWGWIYRWYLAESLAIYYINSSSRSPNAKQSLVYLLYPNHSQIQFQGV